jgi:hypothetical protein
MVSIISRTNSPPSISKPLLSPNLKRLLSTNHPLRLLFSTLLLLPLLSFLQLIRIFKEKRKMTGMNRLLKIFNQRVWKQTDFLTFKSQRPYRITLLLRLIKLLLSNQMLLLSNQMHLLSNQPLLSSLINNNLLLPHKL